MLKKNRTVLFFGSFDPLHEGHVHAFSQARSLGERLLVVVSSDENIRHLKGREPYVPESQRLAEVRAVSEVADVKVSGDVPGDYSLLEELDFDVLALGYDQRPADEEVAQILKEAGKSDVEVVRLRPFLPDRYKSSLFRS